MKVYQDQPAGNEESQSGINIEVPTCLTYVVWVGLLSLYA